MNRYKAQSLREKLMQARRGIVNTQSFLAMLIGNLPKPIKRHWQRYGARENLSSSRAMIREVVEQLDSYIGSFEQYHDTEDANPHGPFLFLGGRFSGTVNHVPYGCAVHKISTMKAFQGPIHGYMDCVSHQVSEEVYIRKVIAWEGKRHVVYVHEEKRDETPIELLMHAASHKTFDGRTQDLKHDPALDGLAPPRDVMEAVFKVQNFMLQHNVDEMGPIQLRNRF